MDIPKTKTLRGIEEKMQGLDANSLRYQILESAKNFKTSWMELGRALYTVHKDKLYKEWGYQSFDTYASREIGIRKQTALKLLRSYYFLEKEEPVYLKEDYAASAKPVNLPSYEAIDLLRLAKNKKNLDAEDYAHLKKEIFQEGRDHREIRKDLSALMRQREELQPEEAYQKKKRAMVKRFLGTLKALHREMESAKIVPAALIKETAQLIKKLEGEIV